MIARVTEWWPTEPNRTAAFPLNSIDLNNLLCPLTEILFTRSIVMQLTRIHVYVSRREAEDELFLRSVATCNRPLESCKGSLGCLFTKLAWRLYYIMGMFIYDASRITNFDSAISDFLNCRWTSDFRRAEWLSSTEACPWLEGLLHSREIWP